MKKTVIMLITAAFLGVFASEMVASPMATVYAAEKNTDSQESSAGEKNDGGHSEHH